MAGVVLDPGAETRLPKHLDVIVRPLGDALRLQQLVLRLEIFHALLELRLDALCRFHNLVLRHHVVGCRKDSDKVQFPPNLSGEGIDLADPVDLVPEELHPVRIFIRIGRKDVEGIPLHAKCRPVEIHFVAVIVKTDQLLHDLVPVPLLARPKVERHLLEVDRTAQTVDTGDRTDDNHIISGRQRGGCRQAQLVDLIVDHRVFLDIRVCLRHICLRLVVIVVGDKILDGVLRKELLELAVELRGQRLVVRDNQRRLLELLDDIRHRVGLSGACHAEQGLHLVAFPEAFHQFPDRLRLISGRLIGCVKPEIHAHPPSARFLSWLVRGHRCPVRCLPFSSCTRHCCPSLPADLTCAALLPEMPHFALRCRSFSGARYAGDGSAANHALSIVQHKRLSQRKRPLRFIKGK